jgi:two-component system, cell cycle response regulator DivK
MIKMDKQKRLVLIVDDFADDREMYSCLLSLHGFQVAVACDGEEALQKAADLLPDVIIMDLSLPGVGGWEAIRRLRAGQRTQQVPILILTARSFVSPQAVGADGCLTKPCQPNELLAEINRVLTLKRDAHLAQSSAIPAF